MERERGRGRRRALDFSLELKRSFHLRIPFHLAPGWWRSEATSDFSKSSVNLLDSWSVEIQHNSHNLKKRIEIALKKFRRAV